MGLHRWELETLIPKTVEPSFGLNPDTMYTLQQINSSINIDDEEWLAWLAETKWSVGSADEEDWSKPGKQFKIFSP